MLSFVSNLLGGRKHARCEHRSRLELEPLEERGVMTAVPAFSSLPGADVTIYLDFDGHVEAEWGELYAPASANIWHNVTTPVFSMDSNPDFSAAELHMIQQIWQCVAEDFAPFDVNVTTVEPAEFGLGAGIRVAIGGSWEDWYQVAPAGGISVTGSYALNGLPKTVYVFSEGFTTARPLADVASQELGHAFGLDHQSIWNNADGSLIAEYNPGTGASAPIMGVPYNSARSLWWKDTLGQNGWGGQDDIAEMTAGGYQFWFRPDDHGGTQLTATVLSNYQIPVQGVIASNLHNYMVGEDIDSFVVNLPANTVLKQWVVSVEVDYYSANLDAKLAVYKIPTGKDAGKGLTLVGIADPGDDLGAMLSFGGAGRYLIVVRSHGGYGDLGQYTLRIFERSVFVPNTDPITMPPLIDVICDPYLPVTLNPSVNRVGLSTALAEDTAPLASLSSLEGSRIHIDEGKATDDALVAVFEEMYGKSR